MHGSGGKKTEPLAEQRDTAPFWQLDVPCSQRSNTQSPGPTTQYWASGQSESRRHWTQCPAVASQRRANGVHCRSDWQPSKQYEFTQTKSALQSADEAHSTQ